MYRRQEENARGFNRTQTALDFAARVVYLSIMKTPESDKLKEWCQNRGIDLCIIERDSDPVLRLEVFQKGKPLYESQPGLFTEQHVLAVKLYDDTEPLRRWRDRALAQRILNLKYVDKTKYVISHQ